MQEMNTKQTIRRGWRKGNKSGKAKRVLNRDFYEEKDLSSVKENSKSTMENKEGRNVIDKDQSEALQESENSDSSPSKSYKTTNEKKHNEEVQDQASSSSKSSKSNNKKKHNEEVQDQLQVPPPSYVDVMNQSPSSSSTSSNENN